MEFIEKYPDKNWNWFDISMNPSITIEFVQKYIDDKWGWKFISNNPNITTEFIEKYPSEDWNWSSISDNKFAPEKEKFILEKLEVYFDNLISGDLIRILIKDIEKINKVILNI